MPTPSTPWTNQPRKSVRQLSSVNVKSELRDLTAANKAWQDVDSRANGLLYNLLGSIYELDGTISSMQAKAALRHECMGCERIRQSKMWRVNKRPPLELLIAFVLGNSESKAATRSQWKKVIRKGLASDIPRRRTAFRDWLHERGGIEGALSGGKTRSANKAVKVEFDLGEYASSVDTSSLALQLDVDLSAAPSFSPKTYTNDLALVLVTKATNLETGKRIGFAVVDVVNDSDLIKIAAQKIRAQHGKH